MKRNLLIALFALAALLASGCPGVSGTGAAGNNDKYAREFLGEWIRMDTGERWYISGDSISVNGVIEDKAATLAKSAAEVITVSEAGGPDYFLFASRVAGASFSVRAVLIDGDETARAAAGRAAMPQYGFPLKIKPLKNPRLEQTVYPDPETGEIIVGGVIPGDPLEISPEDPEWNNVNVGLTPEDGQNMGIIPLTHGVNLKASIRLAGGEDITELYADEAPREYIVEVENIGTVNCVGASYEISWDEEDFELVSGNRRATLDTIVPGAKRQISLALASKPVANGYKNKEISVTIISVDAATGNTLRWEDTVSVNYYKIPVSFRFRSEKPVQGVIRTPRNRTYYFKTSGQGGNYTCSVKLPWSNENYAVTFLGASVETNSETKYSLAVNGQPPSDWESLWGEDMFRYETVNKSVNTAPVLDMADSGSFMYYLYTGAVQYFRINLGGAPPEPGEWQNYFTVYFSSNGGSSVSDQAVEEGGSAFRPADPSRSGYVFDGWYGDPELTTAYDFSAPVMGNITLYAKWTEEALVSPTGVELVYVTGGSFQMGNPDSSVGYSDERPVHTVTLSGFYMGKYEVTQGQYRSVMGTNPSYFTGDNLPVETVTWYNAVAFCNALSEREGLSKAYTINGTNVTANWNASGYRLPTEAQWEYAAKGGDGSPGNYAYSGSNTVGDVAWYSGNSSSRTHEVGTKAPNGLGLYDMSGNVWEWCWDWYGDYSSGAQTDPAGASSGSNRV